MRPLFWIAVSCRFLIRSGRVTVVLSLMLFSALSTLVFLSSLAVGVNDAMIDNSVRLYSGHIAGFDLPRSLRPERLRVAGVIDVLKRVPVFGGLVSVDGVQPMTLVGIDPEAERVVTAIWRKTVVGCPPKRGEASIYLGKPVSDRGNLKPGDKVLFKPGGALPALSLTVCGLFETGIYRFDNGLAFCPGEAFSWETQPWEAAVFLGPGISTSDVLALYRGLHLDYRFLSWEELMPDLRQLISLNFISMSLVTVLVFGVVSIGIACGFVIFILKNMREYGMMKAMGTSSAEIALLIYAKVVLITFSTAVVGCLTGVIAVWLAGRVGIDLTAFTSHNQYFAVSGVIYPRLTAFSLGVPPLAALVFSLLGAVWPTAFLIRKKTADILRSV